MATTDSATTAKKPRTVKVLMWTVTEPWADFLFNLANVVLIVGAAAVLLGTIGAIAMGAAKEHFSSERISANETETARANESAAIANKLAETERLARIKLEVKIAPRRLTDVAAQQFAATLAPTIAGMTIDVVSYDAMGPDVPLLATDIVTALNAAGATARVFTPMGGAGIIHGILVRTSASAPAKEKSAVTPLVLAFQSAELAAGPWAAFPDGEPIAGGFMGPHGAVPATIRILVGSKPPTP